MKTSYLITQLLLASAQFSDIKFQEPREGQKSIKFSLERKGTYKDLVTDKIMKGHFVKQAMDEGKF